MDTRFLSDNSHRQNPEHFPENDSHLHQLKQLRYIYTFPALSQFPNNQPGVYTLTGGIQTGKSTFLKQWMRKLLQEGISHHAISFFPGSSIQNYHDLIQLLQTTLSNKENNHLQVLIIDDLTTISGWEKALKFTAEESGFDHTILMVTSADKMLRKKIHDLLHENTETVSPFKNHFDLYPLTFRETVLLKKPDRSMMELNLFEEFQDYLLHGGYLSAINDVAHHGKILDNTLKAYSDSLHQQIVNAGKNELFLREILGAIINHYNLQMTWNKLAEELSIDHPKTIGDYLAQLESLDTVFIQSALIERTLSAAPKKARKLIFTDPFIFHAIKAWLSMKTHAYENEILPALNHPELCSKLVEACVTTHYRLRFPTFYIKGEGEIDLAYIHNQRYWPIIVSWTNQLRAKDLKQILKYPNGKILTKAAHSGIIDHIRTEPLPQALWKLDEKHPIL